MSKPLSFFWFIPTHGDGNYLGSSVGERQPDFRYFTQIAQAADRLGFEGVLLPTGQNCEESWITATGLATLTERLKFLVALRPGVTLPGFAARQTAALDRLSRGRLLLNVVVGGNPVELAGDGVFSSTTNATSRRRSSSPSGASCCQARPSILPASTIAWKAVASITRRCSAPILRCSSAAPPMRVRTSPPSSATPT